MTAIPSPARAARHPGDSMAARFRGSPVASWCALLLSLLMTPHATAADAAKPRPSALPTRVAAQIGLTTAGCAITQGRFADDGGHLALLATCTQEPRGRRVWLIDLAAGAAAPATPALGDSDPNGESVIGDGTALLWSAGTLYVATTVETRGKSADDPPWWSARYFSARPGAEPQAIKQLPAAIRSRMEHPFGQYAGDDAWARTGDDDAIGDGVFELGKHLVWFANQPGDRFLLRVRSGDGPVTTLAQGHLELTSLLFDAQRLIYPVANGIRVRELDTGKETAVPGSSAGGVPIAWLTERRQLAYSSKRGCDGAAPAGATSICIVTLAP